MRGLDRIVQYYLEKANAFWLYPGEPRKDVPHALLTSGQHSDGYVNVGQVLKEQPEVRMIFAGGIIAALSKTWDKMFDWVVGADTSSTDLARDIATIMGVRHIRMIKIDDKQGKKQIWDTNNESLWDRDIILHIEELITTSSSALQVREGIRLANPRLKLYFAPFLPVLVERSDPGNRVVWVEESRVLPLLQLSIRNYNPGPVTCPYCAVGSQALKPKEGNNWLRLTGVI
jgi:hypothetical protein